MNSETDKDFKIGLNLNSLWRLPQLRHINTAAGKDTQSTFGSSHSKHLLFPVKDNIYSIFALVKGSIKL